VEFGLFDHIEGIPGTSMRQVLRDRIELVKLLDANGFSGYHVAEHHGTDLCLAPNQEIFLAAAAEATTRIRLGPMVKLLPLHHPLRVIEDICVLDQLTGGRVDYGVGRGIAPIEHFWFDGDWFNSHDRFDEAFALIIQGLRTGRVDPEGGKHYSFPPIDVSMTPYQQPNPPFWYPGNPVTAGRLGLNLIWPGPIPQEAYDLYVQNWNEFAGAPVRADRPGSTPRVGVVDLMVVSHDESEAKEIAARGWKGLFRRLVHVHELDRLALTEDEARAALNPQAQAAFALVGPGGDKLLPQFTASSGTPAQVRARIEQYIADGRCDYLVLQLPTGDITMEEARASIQLFIDEVMPNFV
jgi:alkanesulfonate monooxygenase SsuD/methylene tetrahydromethanopterin reductase-like flavin-dependent oxidoreductase (luciferase family)